MANSSDTKVVEVLHDSAGTQSTTELLPSWQAWAKPVGADGSVAVLVVRVWASPANATLTFPLWRLFEDGAVPAAVAVRDVLAHADDGTATQTFDVELGSLPEHGAKFVVLTPK